MGLYPASFAAEPGDYNRDATGESQLGRVARPAQTPQTAVLRPVLPGVSAAHTACDKAKLNLPQLLFQ